MFAAFSSTELEAMSRFLQTIRFVALSTLIAFVVLC